MCRGVLCVSMASIQIDALTLQETVNKAVQARLYLDLSSGDPKRNIALRQFDEQVERIGTKLTAKVAENLNNRIHVSFARALREVKLNLDNGIPGTDAGNTVNPPSAYPGWKPYNRTYYIRKRKENPENLTSFWKKTGKLSKAFSHFTSAYTALMSASPALVSLTSKGPRYRGRLLRYAIDIHLPRMKENKAIEDLLLQSFIQAQAQLIGPPGADLGLNTLALLGKLEGYQTTATSLYRPFIAKVMAKHGKEFHTDVEKYLKSSVKSALKGL